MGGRAFSLTRLRCLERPASAIAALATLTAVGCGRAEWARTVDTTWADSAGIRIVSYRGSDRPLDWEFRESWTVGGAEEGVESFFGVTPAGIATDSAGNVHVLDAGNFRVSVWDSSGRYLRSFGKEGDGPGEMEYPLGLVVLPGGSVMVHDPTKRRPVEYTPAGEVAGGRWGLPRRVGPQIRYTDQGLLFVLRTQTGDRVNDGLFAQTLEDTVRLAEIEVGVAPSSRLESCGLELPGLPPVLAPTLRWTSRAQDVLVSEGAAYSIRWLRKGARLRSIRRTLPLRETTRAVALEALGEGLRVRTSQGEIVCSAGEVVDHLGMAPHVPLIESLHLVGDQLWVTRRQIAGDPGLTDVFDGSGAYVGTLGSGVPRPVAALPDGRVVSLETDALGRQRVKVYQVVGANPRHR